MPSTVPNTSIHNFLHSSTAYEEIVAQVNNWFKDTHLIRGRADSNSGTHSPVFSHMLCCLFGEEWNTHDTSRFVPSWGKQGQGCQLVLPPALHLKPKPKFLSLADLCLKKIMQVKSKEINKCSFAKTWNTPLGYMSYRWVLALGITSVHAKWTRP